MATTIPINLEIRAVAPEQAPLLQARPREGGRESCEHCWMLLGGSLALVSSACALVGLWSLSWTEQEKKGRALSAVMWIDGVSFAVFVINMAHSYYKGWFSPPAASPTAASSTAENQQRDPSTMIRNVA